MTDTSQLPPVEPNPANPPAPPNPNQPARDPTGTLLNLPSEKPKAADGTSPPKPSDSPPSDPSLLNDGKEPKAPAGAPEKYEDFKLPDGVKLDPQVLEKEALPMFKELGLSQEGAQRLVDFHTKQLAAAAEASTKLWKDTQQAWVAEIKADPEIGGKLDLVRTTVSKAIDGVLGPKLGPQFREAMDFTGAGNNPAFIRGFYKFAELVTEGSHVPGQKPSPHGQSPSGDGRPTLAKAIFPNLAG
jgi:hypothetical protein